MRTQFCTYYFASLAIQTRLYGSVYVHAKAPRAWKHGEIAFSVSAYGRSLQAGGHRYKVRSTKNGKPVPSAELRKILAAIRHA
jgi:hypothetical protein